MPNRYPRVFKNLNVFAGNQWHLNSLGNIKKFSITSEDCFNRSEILESTTSYWQSPNEFEFLDWPSAQVYFKVYSQPTTASDANNTCYSAHQTEFPIFLPGPLNDDENNNLGIVMKNKKLESIWLGIQRPIDNNDGWFHEQIPKNRQVYFKWRKYSDFNEPNNVDDLETNVAAVLTDDQLVWNDLSPTSTLPFICLAIVRGWSIILF